MVGPDIDEGLRYQFNQLFVEFTRDKKHEHVHELTVLLDEMLERGSIAPLEYNRLNSVIAIPEKSSDEDAEEEDEMTRVIKYTVNHVIQHDKEELSETENFSHRNSKIVIFCLFLFICSFKIGNCIGQKQKMIPQEVKQNQKN